MHDEFLWHKKEMERHRIQDARVESLKAFTAKDHESDSFCSANENLEAEPNQSLFLAYREDPNVQPMKIQKQNQSSLPHWYL